MKSARHTRIERGRGGSLLCHEKRPLCFFFLLLLRPFAVSKGRGGGRGEEPSLAFFCVDTCLALFAKKEREEGERHINRKKGGRGKRREGKHVVCSSRGEGGGRGRLLFPALFCPECARICVRAKFFFHSPLFFAAVWRNDDTPFGYLCLLLRSPTPYFSLSSVTLKRSHLGKSRGFSKVKKNLCHKTVLLLDRPSEKGRTFC